MLIALLAVLGVNLSVVLFLVAVEVARRVWLRRQAGAFKGAIRVIDGKLPGLGRKWKRGIGRWVGEVLIWAGTPLLFRNKLVAINGLSAKVREAAPGEVRRLGKEAAIVSLAAAGAARIEVATSAGCRMRALGPFVAAASRPRSG